jgi:hypothetical protein
MMLIAYPTCALFLPMGERAKSGELSLRRTRAEAANLLTNLDLLLCGFLVSRLFYLPGNYTSHPFAFGLLHQKEGICHGIKLG